MQNSELEQLRENIKSSINIITSNEHTSREEKLEYRILELELHAILYKIAKLSERNT